MKIYNDLEKYGENTEYDLTMTTNMASDHGTIKGKVVGDKSGDHPIGEVKIKSGGVHSSLSKKNGAYHLKHPSGNDHTLIAEADGYKKREISVSLAEGQSVEKNITMFRPGDINHDGDISLKDALLSGFENISQIREGFDLYGWCDNPRSFVLYAGPDSLRKLLFQLIPGTLLRYICNMISQFKNTRKRDKESAFTFYCLRVSLSDFFHRYLLKASRNSEQLKKIAGVYEKNNCVHGRSSSQANAPALRSSSKFGARYCSITRRVTRSPKRPCSSSSSHLGRS